MAWPFTGVTAPNFDSGFTSLPQSFTAVPSSPGGTSWLLGAYFMNTTGGTINVQIKDGGGTVFYNKDIPAGDIVSKDFTFLPASGTYQWIADVAGIVGKMWGYS